MNKDWREDFYELFEKNTWINPYNSIDGLTLSRDTRHVFADFIEQLLEEERRKTQLETRAHYYDLVRKQEHERTLEEVKSKARERVRQVNFTMGDAYHDERFMEEVSIIIASLKC